MLRPAKFKFIYIAVPHSKEEDVAEYLGKFGYMELYSKRTGAVLDETIEEYSAFLRIFDRMRASYDAIMDLLPRGRVKASIVERISGLFKSVVTKIEVHKIGIDELRKLNKVYEAEVASIAERVDFYKRKLSEIDDLLTKVQIFKKHKVSLDVVGDFTHIFVKAGFLPEVNLAKFIEVIKPFNTVISILEGRYKEKFILIAASQKDKESITNILTMLNFEEVKFPKDLSPDPFKAYEELLNRKQEVHEELKKLAHRVSAVLDELRKYYRYVSYMYNARSAVLRTRNFSVFYGWVEASKFKELVEGLTRLTGGLVHVEATDPPRTEDVEMKPPTFLKPVPILEKFRLIVRMRGLPNYYEVDPTIFFTVLFCVMYGMMFGDVGQGIVLFILGQLLSRIKKSFLGLSVGAINKLGGLLSVASLFSIAFGFLYGESFLLHFGHPIWVNPIENPFAIIAVALIFGAIQIILGISLNIVNNVLRGEYMSAIFDWRGLIGLIYYLSGIALAVSFIEGGLSFAVFTAPENAAFVAIALSILIFVLIKPAVFNVAFKYGHKVSEALMEGVSEFIEMFITYLTNSVSYIRLAAFAIAHGAFALLAEIFASSIGFVVSYLLFNAFVIVLEGVVVGIQAIRLIFYEFSTKFYIGDGRPFRPVKL